MITDSFLRKAATCPALISSVVFVVLLSLGTISPGSASELKAEDFGIAADGRTDDGPAILRMIAVARSMGGRAVRLVFPANKVIFAATGESRYLFSLRNTSNLTIDGNHSTFLLDPALRMADLHFSRNVVMMNFQVDYTVSMFVETKVQSANPEMGYVDVVPNNPADLPHIAGPTKTDGEQWFGGFVWCENGTDPKAARHYSVERVEKRDGGVVRLFHGEGSFTAKLSESIRAGTTAFSVPRGGVAHRKGPGALFDIHDATDITLEGIRVWGAPWFVFSIYRCEGLCRFIDTDVTPKPDSGRLMSACRDAFHVTANRATLIFECCDTLGIGDDDYNFCSLTSRIKSLSSPTEIVVRQKFPIQYNPMRVGETLMVMNAENQIIGAAKISRYIETSHADGNPIAPGGVCPEVRIQLEKPIEGLMPGLTVWSKEASNPDTSMIRCTAAVSIRIQTSLKIDRCQLTCYNVAYGMSPRDDNVEGPGPESVQITRTEFRTGRGSGFDVRCGGVGPFIRTRVQTIYIHGCTFHAPLRIDKARHITLQDNRFHEGVEIGDHEILDARGNTRKGQPWLLRN